MALRPSIAENLSLAIPFLEKWTQSMDENVRRFTTEATRPRGVWCAHISELKEHPELALSLLKTLKVDGARYVQNSVANWLRNVILISVRFATCSRGAELPGRKPCVATAMRGFRPVVQHHDSGVSIRTLIKLTFLNDASKSRPDFVDNLTQSWLAESEGNKATAYIVKRGRRSLGD